MKAWPLTLRGTGTVLLGVLCVVVAQAVGIPDLAWVGLLLVAAVAISVASLLLTPRDDVARVFRPSVAAVGDDVAVAVRLSTYARLPSGPRTWDDRLPDALDGAAAGVLPGVRAWVRADTPIEYRVAARRRGIVAVGPLELTHTDPFRFGRRTHAAGTTSTLTVVPALVALSALDDLPGGAGNGRHTASDPLGQGSDNLIPRPYFPGDSMRRIHWRASAHRDELMVRQEEQEVTPEATVVLDRTMRRFDPDAVRQTGADEGFELAVSACASAIDRLARDGFRVTVIDGDGMPLCERVDALDHAGIDAARIALAPLTTRGEAHLGQLARALGESASGPLVLVTGHVDMMDAADLARLARSSARPVLLTTASAPALAAAAAEAGWRVAALTARTRADADEVWWQPARAADHPVPPGGGRRVRR